MTLLEKVDHLIFAVPDLEEGRDKIERLLGVRPIPGGRHPEFGTHNAQLSLGPTTYLEVLAPDPNADVPAEDVLFGLDSYQEPRLTTWVLHTEEIEKLAASAKATGFDLGAVGSGQRVKPDGTVVSWKFTNPSAMLLNGAVPFLISWGDTPHPAGAAPRAGELIGLRIEHPEPERVRQALLALGLEMDVQAGPQFQLIATIKTSQGDVEVR
ncbi:MAG TPA: VOC family protein [Anaerolineales bacterium]|nr:VOC family protein [Anaerolineales bacterium]